VQIGDNRAAEWVRRSNPVALGLLFSGLAGQNLSFLFIVVAKQSLNPESDCQVTGAKMTFGSVVFYSSLLPNRASAPSQTVR
jgi:hypothetical protein